jgi:phosphate transport system protein
MRVMETDLLAMADLVSNSIDNAVRALLHHDHALATAVIDDDNPINDLFQRIEREILEVIATQQPMAKDLREVLAIFAIATDLERIGDYAKGIAKVTRRSDAPYQAPALVLIDQMRALVREVLASEMDSFIHRDPEAARAAAARDDEIDQIYVNVYEETFAGMMADREAIKPNENLLWAAKGLERCGDHVTNIGERVVFLTTGLYEELND